MTMSAPKLPPLSEDRLTAARAQLHQAVQLLAAIGISYIDPLPDDSHTALDWSTELKSFSSKAFGPEGQIKVTLDPASLTVSIYHGQELNNAFTLDGINLAQASAILVHQLGLQGLKADKFTLDRHYNLPDYPDHLIEAFDTADLEAFQGLSLGYQLAEQAFASIIVHDSRVGSILTWPHHFDMAILTPLAHDDNQQLIASMGSGFSPGDKSIPAPYFYVTLWPAPPTNAPVTHPVKQGEWYAENWLGVILKYEDLAKNESLDAQLETVNAFLYEARGIALKLSQNERIAG